MQALWVELFVDGRAWMKSQVMMTEGLNVSALFKLFIRRSLKVRLA